MNLIFEIQSVLVDNDTINHFDDYMDSFFFFFDTVELLVRRFFRKTCNSQSALKCFFLQKAEKALIRKLLTIAAFSFH